MRNLLPALAAVTGAALSVTLTILFVPTHASVVEANPLVRAVVATGGWSWVTTVKFAVALGVPLVLIPQFVSLGGIWSSVNHDRGRAAMWFWAVLMWTNAGFDAWMTSPLPMPDLTFPLVAHQVVVAGVLLASFIVVHNRTMATPEEAV